MTRQYKFSTRLMHCKVDSRTVYRVELAVASQSVSVTANGAATVNIASTEAVSVPNPSR